MPARTVVLLSAGLDSAVLVAHVARRARVVPVYVSAGLAWEDAEWTMVRRLLAAPAFAGVGPPERLVSPVGHAYPPTHWAVRGEPPAYDTADEEVYLAGRNLLLLAAAGLAAARAGAGRIALGPLAGNPFPDARPAFFAAMARALSLGLDHRVEIATPFLSWHKARVVRRGAALGVPFELTLSCMKPLVRRTRGAKKPSVLHCGLCSKCRERRDAFVEAGVVDPASYAHPAPR